MLPLEFLIQRRIIALREDTPAHQAARTMCEKAVGCVLVTDAQDQLVGVVTDRDLACLVLGHLKNPDTPISEVMTPRPLTVEQNADLELVIHLMEESGIRRIPVVEWNDGQGQKCIGLVTFDDLVASKRASYDQIARVVRSQVLRRTALRIDPKTRSSRYATGRQHPRPSLDRFYQTVQAETGLSGVDLEIITSEILATITRRLQYTGAAHFISSLPDRLQEKLLDLPPGPDRQATVSALLTDIQKRLKCSSDQASILLRKFFRALEILIVPFELENIRSQFEGELGSPIKPSPSSKRIHAA